jgi:hypothetical protein
MSDGDDGWEPADPTECVHCASYVSRGGHCWYCFEDPTGQGPLRDWDDGSRWCQRCGADYQSEPAHNSNDWCTDCWSKAASEAASESEDQVYDDLMGRALDTARVEHAMWSRYLEKHAEEAAASVPRSTWMVPRDANATLHYGVSVRMNTPADQFHLAPIYTWELGTEGYKQRISMWLLFNREHTEILPADAAHIIFDPNSSGANPTYVLCDKAGSSTA